MRHVFSYYIMTQVFCTILWHMYIHYDTGIRTMLTIRCVNSLWPRLDYAFFLRFIFYILMRTELGEVKHRSIIYNIPLLNDYTNTSILLILIYTMIYYFPQDSSLHQRSVRWYMKVVGVDGGTFKRTQNIQRCGTYSRC